MALFHLNVSSIGKGKASSAVAAAAYRSCSLLNQFITDSKTGLSIALEHNYSNKKGLAFSQIFAPRDLDEWCYDREKLWNKVEETETHIKGRFARDLKLALQIEFSLEKNIQLLSEYVENVFVKDGIIADVNIHMDDPNNPHAHIMLTTRDLVQNENGEWRFGNKKRLLDSNGWLVYIRSSWAEINNKYFAMLGIDKTISHESYKTRGLDFIKSTIHEGAARHTETDEKTLERPEYNRNIIIENLHYIKGNPLIVIQTLSKNISAINGIFSRNDLYKAIDRFLDEIASRGEDAKILIEEARAEIYSQCDEMFKDINHLDLSLDKVFELSANLSSNDVRVLANNLQVVPTIQENIVSLIEEFSKKAGNRLNVSDELEFIRLNPDKLIESVSKKQAVFNKIDLAKALDAHINEAIFKEIEESEVELFKSAKVEILEKYDALLASIQGSQQMVKLVDSDLAGKEIYTTKSQLSLEKEFITNIESLAASKKHSLNLMALSPNKLSLTERLNNSLSDILTPDAVVSLEKIVASIFGTKKAVNLSDEQSNAVMQLLNGGDIVALSGMPGTGKSTVMAKLAQEYNNHGYEVIGAATSAVAALNLGVEAGINSYTLSKLQHDWELRKTLEERGEDVRKLLPYLSSKNIVIIDEMSMVDLSTFNYIITQVIKVEAKVIVVGDNNQFSSIGIGGASEKIVEKVENVTLTELFRQQSNVDKEITRKLAKFRVDEALILLDEQGRIRISDSPEIARSELINHYISQIHNINGKAINGNSDNLESDNNINNTNSSSISSSIRAGSKENGVIIAYRNKEVQALNNEIRTRLLDSGLLYSKAYEKGGKEFIGSRGKMLIALGEQIVFTKNHRYLGVLNGQLAKVVEIIDDSRFNVQLLGKGAGIGSRKNIIINNEKFVSFDYGYAITAYRAQGRTYDHSYLLLDASVGYEAFYVMATRHRLSSIFYIDKQLLNEIIRRRFESLKEVYHQSSELNINQDAAMFELLLKRNPNALAHDYIDYDKRSEVIQIRTYLEYKDEASRVYRELLNWQEDEIHKGNNPKLWENELLWSEFSSACELRKAAAQELVEGYTVYQKYINSSVANYATLLKHAGSAEIEFDYQSVLEGNLRKKPLEEVTAAYQQIIDLHQPLLNARNEQISVEIATRIAIKAEELIAITQEYKSNLARLSSQIHAQENIKWGLESQRKANLYYSQDFSNYLNEIYKEGSQSVLNSWRQLKNSMGIKDALIRVENNPEMLGNLLGLGWSTKLSISDKRATAVFNLKSLITRLETYEKSIEEAKKFKLELEKLDTTLLDPLKDAYKQMSSSSYLSQKQEQYLYEIIEHKQDLISWFKTSAKLEIKEEFKETESNTYSLGSDSKMQSKKVPIDTRVSADIGSDTNANTNDSNNVHSVSQSKITPTKIDKRSNANHIADPKLSYGEIHAKLGDNIIDLSKQLLPLISKKRIEITKHDIRCGSIRISLEAQSRGLWYRFSRNDEKGDLFDLIKVAQGLSNKQTAIEWGKSYLGIEYKNLASEKFNLSVKHQDKDQEQIIRDSNEKNIYEKVKTPDLKILTPVPLNAVGFNPKKLFYYQLSTKKQMLEDVYEYRNINNELCGYVIRIKDQTTDKKVTLPVVYTENDKGIRSWRSRGFGDNRCLYNEQRLYNSNKPVLIVEGEKTANNAQSLYPEFDVISWSGGAGSYDKSNWNVLQGKQVTIWPDNDKAGIDAAHNIKSLLENNNITKAKIIDLKQIDFLPQKWDLADELIDDMRQYQITGLLCVAEGVSDSVRIEKTLKSYMEHRENYLEEEFKANRFNSLGEYILERETIKYRLHYEANLAKDKLQSNSVISNTDELFIDVDAAKLARANIKCLDLSADMDPETITKYIEHDLAQMHQAIPKTTLTEFVKLAIVHTQQSIDQHNTLHHSRHNDKAYDHYENSKLFNLSKADLPILALALASETINHANKMNVNENYINATYASSLDNNISDNHIKVDHLINSLKNSFKSRIEQDSIHFEQHHQQQIVQMQRSRQHNMEI